MDMTLTDEDLRVLGCLLEKKMATPDYYPLTLNSLVNACNQKVNRDPVVSYSEDTVLKALKELKAQTFVVQSTSGRVPKYQERFAEEYNLNEDEAAVMCVLMLRGAQTAGELKIRTDRLCGFNDLEEVNDTLESLISMGYAIRLPRQPGQKEVRCMHLLSGKPDIAPVQEVRAEKKPAAAPSTSSVVEQKRIDMLEERVHMLSAELHKLRQEFAAFRQQFE